MAATTLYEVLAAVPDAWVADVRAVTGLSGPALASPSGPVIPGPTFTGSVAVGGADADVIIGTTMVEIKATGAADLRLRDAQQVIGYALLDFDDIYTLSRAALLSARYGRLVTWDLVDGLVGEDPPQP